MNAKEVHENVTDEALDALYLDQMIGIFLGDDDLENVDADSKEIFDNDREEAFDASYLDLDDKDLG